MNQITPAPLDSPPDFVPADGPEQSASSRDRIILLIFAVLGIYAVFTLGAWSSNRSPQPPPTGPYTNNAPAPRAKILVHVAGAVRRPGVYELPPDARVHDAIKRAVPQPNADTNALNLAAWAEDGSRIEVPVKESRSTPVSPPTASPIVPQPLVQLAPEPGEVRPAKAKAASATPKPAPTAKKAVKAPPRVVNINRASLDDLTLLPGVGPAIAERILDYRKENGAFSSVDELDEVKGIGEKKLEKMRPYVSVK